jgi:putative oxidoreductase
LMIRLYWGLSFFFSGRGKLMNLSRTSEFFQSLNIPFPELNAFLAGSAECVGGLCLVVGFASRLASLPLMGTMLVAYLTAHFDAVKSLLQNPDNFISQQPFNFLMAALIVFSFGPGAFSLDALIKRFLK